MKQGIHQLVPIDQITLDKSNPRIALWLEIYPGEPTIEQIELALGAGFDDKEAQGGIKFSTLRNSIQTHGGIIQPVLLNSLPNKRKICIEGNTRVCLYRMLRDQKAKGNWEEIPAIVYTDLDQESIDAIRLQAHLVGPRQWDPYSKAKYLTLLRNKEDFPLSKLVEYCGGSQKSVMESIDAFADMETYYRPLCESEGDFDPSRFSGFVELQKNNVKTALNQAGYRISDFAKWIHERKFGRLEQVRHLPKILKNKQATHIFIRKGATEAIKVLDRPELAKALQEATLGQLCQALAEVIGRIQHAEVKELRNNPGSDINQAILDAQEAINGLVKDVGADE